MGSVMRAVEATPETTGVIVQSGRGIGTIEVHVKGQPVQVPAVEIDGRIVISGGRLLKVATIRHEELVEGDSIANPESFIAQLKKSKLKADVLTFTQRVPDSDAKYKYHVEWENAAAVPIIGYERWWKERTEYSIRKSVNRAKKLGVDTRVVEFNDDFVRSAMPIFSESPTRQGKAFWHYGKDFETVKSDLSSYVDRSVFIGSYVGDDLIGYMKITRVGTTGAITQILSMVSQFDKRPNNALIAKAVEWCESAGLSHFIYGSYVYYDPNSTLTEFKKRHGFESIPLPRYYVPLTLKGHLALRLGLHRNVQEIVPKTLYRTFLKLRKRWYSFKQKGQESQTNQGS